MKRLKTMGWLCGVVGLLSIIFGTASEARTQHRRPGGTPGFTGTWTVVPDGGGSGRGAPGGPITVTETENELKIERQGRNGPMVTIYKLDGTESEVAGRGGVSFKATTKWDDDKLVITTKTDNGDSIQTWSLEDSNLKIERTGPQGIVVTKYQKNR